MIHFKSGAITLSLALYFLASAVARKTSRDASQVGYSYEKPGNPLEIPKNIKEPEEEVTTEEINSTRTPTDGSYEEYLPPKTSPPTHPSGGEDELLKRPNDKKRDLQKTKTKFVKQQQLSFPSQGGGGIRQKNVLAFQNNND